jgi:hypothetical protein
VHAQAFLLVEINKIMPEMMEGMGSETLTQSLSGIAMRSPHERIV